MAGPHRLQQGERLLTQRLGPAGEHPWRRGAGDEVLALEGAPPESDPEQQVLETLGEEELTRRILALREPYKTPCRLMLLEQHTAVEAARLCGRPQKTVEAQVYRAKKMLAAQLRASGAEAPQKPERRNQNG